eukprot:9489155-Pyramimonas_sp.AAC.1
MGKHEATPWLKKLRTVAGDNPTPLLPMEPPPTATQPRSVIRESIAIEDSPPPPDDTQPEMPVDDTQLEMHPEDTQDFMYALHALYPMQPEKGHDGGV